MVHTESAESPQHKHLPVFLLVAYLMFWAFLAFAPYDRFDWWLENILVFVFLPILIFTYNRFRLSNISYVCIFVFMMQHAIGAHYTYAEVPFGYWLQALFHTDRNFYDRIVHFSFGLLLGYPIRELFHRVGSAKGFWGYWFPFELTLAFSALYEIFEMAGALLFGGGASAFLGTQGDVWDAQWDMTMAGLGALLSMLITLAVNIKYNRHLGQEIEESLEVKESEPLGEVKLQELEDEKKADDLESKFAQYRQKKTGRKPTTEEPPTDPSEPDEPLSDEPIEDIGTDVERHNHSPEEILRLLHGENIHRVKATGTAKGPRTPKPKKLSTGAQSVKRTNSAVKGRSAPAGKKKRRR